MRGACPPRYFTSIPRSTFSPSVNFLIKPTAPASRTKMWKSRNKNAPGQLQSGARERRKVLLLIKHQRVEFVPFLSLARNTLESALCGSLCSNSRLYLQLVRERVTRKCIKARATYISNEKIVFELFFRIQSRGIIDSALISQNYMV